MPRTLTRYAAPESRRTSITGLPPIASADARVLVLGSIPGERSLALGQYYVGQGNRMWYVMASIFGHDPGRPYHERVEAMKAEGIAMWDVIHSCRRIGSVDSQIVRGSEVLNDFDAFFDTHTAVRAVVFNGQTARTLFDRLGGGDILGARGLPAISLPSTSATNARRPPYALVQRWRILLRYV